MCKQRSTAHIKIVKLRVAGLRACEYKNSKTWAIFKQLEKTK